MGISRDNPNYGLYAWGTVALGVVALGSLVVGSDQIRQFNPHSAGFQGIKIFTKPSHSKGFSKNKNV